MSNKAACDAHFVSPLQSTARKTTITQQCSSAQHTKRNPHVYTSEGGWMKHMKEADQETVEAVAMIPVCGPQELSLQLRESGSSKGVRAHNSSFLATEGPVQFSQLSCSVMSDSLRLHGLKHIRLPCPSPTPGTYPNSGPLSRWCHLTISSSVVPFSSCLQSFPVSGSFQMSQFFASGDQSIGVSASASVLPMNIQGSFPLRWIGWISFQFKGLSRVFSNTTVQKHQFFRAQLSL